MAKQPRKFCENQTICEEDVGKGAYTCMADLAEGRAFQCHYSESDIKIGDLYGTGKFRFYIQKNPKPGADGICMDFEITKKIKKDLTAKLV